jgi:CheY-like chemotaxis protein
MAASSKARIMSKTLLFIDNAPDDVMIARSNLARAGVLTETLHAQSRAELVSLLTDHAIDLIVSDFHLQFWEGIDILKAAKSRVPTVPSSSTRACCCLRKSHWRWSAAPTGLSAKLIPKPLCAWSRAHLRPQARVRVLETRIAR